MSIRLLTLLIVASFIGLSACKKSNDAPAATKTIGINVINASVDTFNFYLNGTRKNNNSNIDPAASTGYYFVSAIQQAYSVKKVFNTAGSTVQTLFGGTIPLDNNPYHSLFVTGETVDQAFSTIDILKPDTAAAVASITCYVRFVNASPDAGGLDVTLGNSALFQNVAFKNASSFVLVSTVTGVSKTGRLPLKIFASGSASPAIIDSVSLAPGKSYTFYALGKKSATGTAAFGVGSMINFN